MRRQRFVMLAAAVLLTALAAACRVDYPQIVPTLAAVATAPVEQGILAPTVVATEAATASPSATPPPATDAPPAPTATATAERLPTAEPTADATAAAPAPELPAGVFYDLGEVDIIQANFAEDSRFRNMPVRLNGVLAVPEPADGPFPVVVVLHGTHPGCPVNEFGVDAWPCGDEEQDNYAGFEYLVRELAARGYVALSININAQNTFGFGEPAGGERLEQIVHLHLSALAAAAAGGANDFGVPLAGVADARRLTFIGHSRGGEGANWLAGDFMDGPGLAGPYTYANRGYGPLNGLLLVAPAMAVFGTEGTDVPLAVVISGCDGDVVTGDGQAFYEAVRLGERPNYPTLSVLLERANHNNFNTILGPDLISPTERESCATPLEPEAQRRFLVDFAADFLTTIYGPDPAEVLAARSRLGMDAAAPAPSAVMAQASRVSSLAAAEERLPLFIPAAADELSANRQAGATTAAGIATHFCEEGYSTPQISPGSEPCLRPNLTMPGFPAMLVVEWDAPGGELRFELPEGARDLSRYTTVSLRAAVDPLSPLNEPGAAQQFSVRLTDGAGNVAAIPTSDDQPALRYLPGAVSDSEFFGPIFSELLPMTTIRLPLAGLAGVDLADVVELALVFDQTDSGRLLLGDVELIRPPHIIGAYSTLLQNAAGESADYSGVARLHGASTCSGAFVAPGSQPDAPAYLITNGHCAQEWDANAVFLDQPANDWRATFNYFIDTAGAQVVVPVARVVYSTMKGRDVAFLELEATVGELLEQGIRPLEIAAAVPEGAFELRVVGAPVIGVPPEIAFTREERCRGGGTANLFEFIWHFNDAIPNVCQDIYGGSSGSPVFAGDDAAIIALINTTNIGGQTPCGLGSPCEARPSGTLWLADTSYATPVVGLAACFGADGRFDLSAAGCPLDEGRQLLIGGFPTQGTRNPLPAAGGPTDIATWQAALSGDLPFYRYKTGRAGEVDCRAEEGYGQPRPLAGNEFIDDPLPVEEGSYLLCVLAGESATVDETWQPVEWPTVARVEVDNTPPAQTPRLSFLSDGFGGFRFEPIFFPPELSHFEVKFGPQDETDCADPEGYAPYRRLPLSLPAESLPARICIIGYDTPGNAAAPHEVLVNPRGR